VDSPLDIVIGVKDYLLGNNEELYQKRVAVCFECPMYSLWGVCGKCGCNLQMRLRNPNLNCPVGKW
jgi:hypothetical protein